MTDTQRTAKGGARVGSGRKALPPGVKRKRHTITLDPALTLLVQWHASARGQSVSESVNQLIGEAIHQLHEIDAEKQEVY